MAGDNSPAMVAIGKFMMFSFASLTGQNTWVFKVFQILRLENLAFYQPLKHGYNNYHANFIFI